MSVFVGLAAGLVMARVAVRGGRAILSHPMLVRTNVRGQSVPTAGGLLGLLSAIVLAAVTVAAERIAGDVYAVWSNVVIVVLGFGMLGLVDDLLGDDAAKGFRGHLSALRRGSITTGLVKLAGGGALAFIVAHRVDVARPGPGDAWMLLVDAALIAFAANLGNLFDRAPGRVLKVGALAWLAVAVALGANPTGVAVAMAMGGFFGLFPEDVRERLMLGDTGANAVGALVGFAVVAGLNAGGRIGIALALLVLNVASERISFSRVIDACAPLRWFDALGRPR